MNHKRMIQLLASVLIVVPTYFEPALAKESLIAAGLAGTWAGVITHDGQRETIALDIEPDDQGKNAVRLSMPAVHLDHVTIGRFETIVRGDSVRLGPFTFAYDRRGGTLRGWMPAGLVPVYEIPMVLAKTDRYVLPDRAPIIAPERAPAWTFDAGSPLWAGPTFADDVVYVGTEDGRLFAINARTGVKKWTFEAGGAIRIRPTVSAGALYVQADDGFLYALNVKGGTLRWRTKIVEKPIERLPFNDPRSRYDRFGSDVTIADGQLYVGTHDGKLLALSPEDGREIWSFTAGDAVLAAPTVQGGRVFFGSYDHYMYALGTADGHLLWKRDTRGAVVSTPALYKGLVIVGNRCYDLLALDATTGNTAWKQYVWMSWVESSATVRDAIAYVGSSDAAALFAIDAATGARTWATDVYGWSWGSPAVTETHVYAGTSGQVGYPTPHDGSVLALDRSTGEPVWRYVTAPPDSGAFGFPGSPAVGAGFVFAGGLDGRLYAFAE